MKTAICFISGFREHEFGGSGTQALHALVDAEFDCLPNVKVFDLEEWKVDAKKWATHLADNGYTHLIIYGYSWGGGYGAQRLAREFGKRGGMVRLMALCDAVYRPLWLPTWGPTNVFSARSMTRFAKIEIPSNVGRVVWCRQTISRPAGHDLKAESIELTRILPPIVLPWPHTKIDESPIWHAAVLREIRNTLAVQP